MRRPSGPGGRSDHSATWMRLTRAAAGAQCLSPNSALDTSTQCDGSPRRFASLRPGLMRQPWSSRGWRGQTRRLSASRRVRPTALAAMLKPVSVLAASVAPGGGRAKIWCRHLQTVFEVLNACMRYPPVVRSRSVVRAAVLAASGRKKGPEGPLWMEENRSSHYLQFAGFFSASSIAFSGSSAAAAGAAAPGAAASGAAGSVLAPNGSSP